MCITTGRLGFGQVKQPNRDVAQPGSALAWGARGREFESRHPDQPKALRFRKAFFMGASQAERLLYGLICCSLYLS